MPLKPKPKLSGTFCLLRFTFGSPSRGAKEKWWVEPEAYIIASKVNIASLRSLVWSCREREVGRYLDLLSPACSQSSPMRRTGGEHGPPPRPLPE